MSRLIQSKQVGVAVLSTAIGLACWQTGAMAYENSALERGDAQMSHRDYDGALNSFGEAIGFDMNNAEAYQKRGQCFYQMKNYQSALTDFNHLLTLKPRDAQAMLWAGTAESRLGHNKAAVDFYLRAMRADPQLVNQSQRPASGAINPHNEGAVSAYEEAIALYRQEGKHDDVTDFAASKKSDMAPSGMGTDSTLKTAQVRVEELNAAIQADPSNATLFFKRGRAHKELGNVDKAVADFSEAIRLDPMQSRFYIARARVYHEQHQPELSAADITKAQNVNPRVSRHFKFVNDKDSDRD